MHPSHRKEHGKTVERGWCVTNVCCFTSYLHLGTPVLGHIYSIPPSKRLQAAGAVLHLLSLKQMCRTRFGHSFDPVSLSGRSRRKEAFLQRLVVLVFPIGSRKMNLLPGGSAEGDSSQFLSSGMSRTSTSTVCIRRPRCARTSFYVAVGKMGSMLAPNMCYFLCSITTWVIILYLPLRRKCFMM